jgi:hypothetical protein
MLLIERAPTGLSSLVTMLAAAAVIADRSGQQRFRLPKLAISPRAVPKPARSRDVQIPPIEPGGFEAALIFC